MPPIASRAESARINLRNSPEAKALIKRADAGFYARYGFQRFADKELSLFLTTDVIQRAIAALQPA